MKRVIVLYEDDLYATDLEVLNTIGAKIHRRFQNIAGVSAFMSDASIKLLSGRKRIKGIYEDTIVHTLLSESVPQINADQVHILGKDGSGVRVCVVDTGIDDSHSALNTVIAEYDFVNNDNDATDDNGHGTHVAGIVASTHALYGGTAPGASMMAAKVLGSRGSGFTSDVIAGVDWCVANGADIISMSLGGGSSSGPCDNQPLSQASNAAVDLGVTVFAASGNDGNSSRISSPACASKVISVGSVSKSDTIASYSNGGAELDIVAPGSSIVSTYLNDDLENLSGTSMATPHAAGVAALMLQTAPELLPGQVRSILRSTAVDLGPVGFDFAYGYGRIDAAAAYLSALNGPPPPPPPTEIVFIDDFQSGNLHLWNEKNEFDWTVDSPAERQVPGAVNDNLVGHADRCTSADGCILEIAENINLTEYESASLSFWQYIDRSLDAGESLEVQAFDGSLWDTIFFWTHNQGDNDIWKLETYDLSVRYLVENFGLRFVSKQSSGNEDTEIDDVLIEGVLPQNLGPQANAGPDQTVNDDDGTGNESITLDGSASTDDEAITSYEWKDGSTILGNSEILTSLFSVGVHSVTLLITDNEGETSTDTVTITVNPNASPIAEAGADQILSDGDDTGSETVTLNGSGSNDPDGTIVRYEWKNDTITIGSGVIIAPSLPVGVHTITLTVVDNGGSSSSGTTVITVEEFTVQPIPRPIFQDDFEDTLTNWDESGDGNWTISSPGEEDVPGSLAGNSVAHAEDCETSAGCTLTLKNPIDLTGFTNATLYFWRFVDRSLDNGEYLRIDAFDGNSWNTIFYWTDDSGDDDEWHKESFDLLSGGYGVSNFQLRIVTKESSSLEEVEIDDVLIEGY